jgi:nucleoside-triphosphatase THEP1
MLLRSALILVAWVSIISPAMKWLMNRWLGPNRKKWKQEMEKITSLLPEMRSHFQAAWSRSRQQKGGKRLRLFRSGLLLRVFGEESRVTILSGPIASGKTTALHRYLSSRSPVAGILTPRQGTVRVFHDLAGAETFPMLASADDPEAVHVGKFRFSKKSFEKAGDILKHLQQYKGTVVIDEIGPLELRGGGFDSALRTVLANPPRELILVVRESLLSEVTEHYEIRVFDRLPYSSLPNTLSVPLAAEKSS